MTTIDTARLRALASAATPGPWKAGSAWVYTDPIYPDDNRLFNVFGMDFADNVRQEAEHQRGLTNAEYIAAIDPSTLLALLDRLEELEGREPEWEYAVRWVQTEGQPVTDIGADREDIDALVLSQDGYAEAVRRKAGPWEPVTGDGDAHGA